MAVAEDIEVKPFATTKKNDTEIARMIADTLKWDSVVQDDKIRVKVEDGWVTLDGIVDWEFQKEISSVTPCLRASLLHFFLLFSETSG